MTNSTNAVDALRYAAALLRQRAEWTTNGIDGSCDIDHDIELDAIDDTVHEIAALAAQFGDPRRYTDGRLVKSSREIEPGVVTEHVWLPNPADEKPNTWRGTLRHDPDDHSPGVYEVSTTPATQQIDVRVVRMA